MKSYFARRLLLVPITFLVITFVVYTIVRKAPGGPIEQEIARMRMQAMVGEAGGGSSDIESGDLLLDEDSFDGLRRFYSLDRAIPIGYLQWLGAFPRDVRSRVPIVSRKKNPEAHERLSALEAARDEAVEARDEYLAGESLVAFRGELFRRVGADEEEGESEGEAEDEDGSEDEGGDDEDGDDESDDDEVAALPAEIRERALELAASTFGDRFELHELLRPHGFAHDGGGFLKDASDEDWSKKRASWDRAADLVRKAEDAEEALAAYERESGLYRDESGHLRYRELRPLIRLRRHWEAADDALEEHLKQGTRELLPESLAFEESLGRLCRTLRPSEWDEGDAFEKKAAQLRSDGFLALDDLREHLSERDLYYKGGKYLTRFDDEDEVRREVAETSPEALERFLRVYRRIVEARAVAARKIQEVRDAQGYEVDEDGVVYTFERKLAGILQLDFGRSYTHGEPVLGLIASRMKISLIFGLSGFFLVYLICIPLGVTKAIYHRKGYDTATSILVFLGYSIPGFVLATLLFATVAVNVDWLPLGGAAPANIEELGWWEGLMGRLQHMIIPVIAYMVGSFATLTILTKNALLDNLGQDYVRTAFAKGLRERRVLFVHALRNSLIPVTATIGHALGLLFAGSFLIEKACNIDGMGLLGYHAILERDYPITLGLLVFGVLIQLFGNIFSDLIWALIDPRIRFGK